MGGNFSIASKKHQNDFDVLVIVRKWFKNGIAISFLKLSTVAEPLVRKVKPKRTPSPSAPAIDIKPFRSIWLYFFALLLTFSNTKKLCIKNI